MPAETAPGKPSFKEQLLFYTTAFFILLATFSLFGFLFLVPFFVEPALTTLYLKFEPKPTQCVTVESNYYQGSSKCQWASCREGCTKEIFECRQIFVQYLGPRIPEYDDAPKSAPKEQNARMELEELPVETTTGTEWSNAVLPSKTSLTSDLNLKSLYYNAHRSSESPSDALRIQSVLPEDADDNERSKLSLSKYFAPFWHSNEHSEELLLRKAKLQPNAKGCGYPPDVNCTEFEGIYGALGTNFSCYYSLVDPTLIITSLDIDQVRLDLIYCLTLPIICFIVSVIYLFFAYFKIYADEPPPTVSSADDDGTNKEHEDAKLKSPTLSVTSPVSLRAWKGHPAYLLEREKFRAERNAALGQGVRRAKSGSALVSVTEETEREFGQRHPPHNQRHPNQLPPVRSKYPPGHPKYRDPQKHGMGMRQSVSMGARVADQQPCNCNRLPPHDSAQSSALSLSSSHLPPSTSSSSTLCTSCKAPPTPASLEDTPERRPFSNADEVSLASSSNCPPPSPYLQPGVLPRRRPRERLPPIERT